MISLEYAKAYLVDRIAELRNQLPLGDPFIFLGILSIAHTLQVLAKHSTKRGEVHTQVFDILCRNTSLRASDILELHSMCTYFSLEHTKLSLTHDDEKHGTIQTLEDGTELTVVSAGVLIDNLEIALHAVFDNLTELQLARMLVKINEERFIGLRK